MRKKPDIILLLAVLVIPGVVISNLVVIKPNKITHLSSLSSHYLRLQTEKNMHSFVRDDKSLEFKSQAFARIDLLKQRTR